MSKFLLNTVKVVVNSKDLSDHAFNVDTPEVKEQVDVSGFSATLTKEFLPGTADQTITVQLENAFAANSVDATLKRFYAAGSAFPVYVQPDMNAGTAAANPLFGGTAVMFEYNGLSGALNARAELTATFKPAPGSRFSWGTVAP
jgi:hypothetical protein